jgi:hypothetical protein
MAQRTWQLTLEDGPHTVELDHSYWTTRRRINVDGRLLTQADLTSKGMYGLGSEDSFRLGTHTLTVYVRSNGFSYNYDLGVDGRSVTTGQAAAQPIPGWAWLFVAACMLIPLITLGGAIPAVIGVAGAVGCSSIARDPSKPTAVRAALCSGIVVLCWSLLIGFLLMVGGIRR